MVYWELHCYRELDNMLHSLKLKILYHVCATYISWGDDGRSTTRTFVTHHHEMSRKSRWLITSKPVPLKSKWIKNIYYFFIAETHQ